jgi:hypothetical protein
MVYSSNLKVKAIYSSETSIKLSPDYAELYPRRQHIFKKITH